MVQRGWRQQYLPRPAALLAYEARNQVTRQACMQRAHQGLCVFVGHVEVGAALDLIRHMNIVRKYAGRQQTCAERAQRVRIVVRLLWL